MHMCGTAVRTMHMCYTAFSFLVLILGYNYVRCNLWGKLDDEYTRPLQFPVNL